MDYLFITIGLSIGVFLTWLFLVFKRKQTIRNDVDIVMSGLKKVSKLVTVEGEFSEIYKHQESVPLFFNWWKTEKKAIIVIRAKVMMGYDLTKLQYEIDTDNKILNLLDIPKPEILSLTTDAEYFDVKNGTFNPFSQKELEQIKDEAKHFMIDKIYQSSLPKMAAEQSKEGFALLEDTTKSLGWKLVHK